MMLSRNMQTHSIPSLPISTDNTYDWRWMVKAIRNRIFLIILIAALLSAAAVAFVQYRPAAYTASSTLNITNLRLTMSRDDAFFAELQFDPTFLETQMRIISSDSVLMNVLSKLQIIDSSPATAENPPSAERTAKLIQEAEALDDFRRALDVQRLGMSNLVSIRYTAETAERAATVANTVTETYLAKLEQDRLEAAETASSWLRERLQEVGPKAQVVSEALPPVHKSDIRGIFIIVLAAIIGVSLGAVISLVLAFFDKRIRSPEQIMEIVGKPCMGLVPTLPRKRRKNKVDLLYSVANQPSSGLWHTLRHLDTVVTSVEAKGPNIVGFTSTISEEGKTTIAGNFAVMKARAGKKVLLIDADPYRKSLSHLLVSSVDKTEKLDLANGADADIASLIEKDQTAGFAFLRLGDQSDMDVTTQLFWSETMPKLSAIFKDYDLVIFDLPPLVALGDLQNAAQVVDKFILIVDWGKLTGVMLQTAMVMNPTVHEKIAGVVLNRADRSRMKKVFSPFAALLGKQSLLVGAKRR
ncbi:nucleotide-binding protein [Agrobacterium sp. Azo12]|uniref:nucleotide-binding protein n=1 Tax=Agrobacterium sp. Azo12 TaxID=3031129 RepID=UPI0023D7C4E0|nr:AAA family ATPase [Agrobacterium sp. Azo12]MDO5898575.1 AAA family ATPase [Agrobacterium sp. Azo12]